MYHSTTAPLMTGSGPNPVSLEVSKYLQFARESGLRFAINEYAGLCIFQLPFPLLRRRTATAQGRQPAPRLVDLYDLAMA